MGATLFARYATASTVSMMPAQTISLCAVSAVANPRLNAAFNGGWLRLRCRSGRQDRRPGRATGSTVSVASHGKIAVRSDREDELAHSGAALEHPVGLGGLFQRENRGHTNLDGA